MSHEIELSALDGGNPLALLAALGTLATASEAPGLSDVRLGWRWRGAWRPYLVTHDAVERGHLVEALASVLGNDRAARPFEIQTVSGDIAEDLTILPTDYRRYARRASEACIDEPRLADFAAAFGSESAVGMTGQIVDTAFRTMSGAGHQHFLGSMRELVAKTKGHHLSAALFEEWTYQDDRPTMRWDPEDERRYALRWREPSGDKIQTVRGANRLAVEGLRCFPVSPVGRRALTTGFTGRGASDTFFTWPIWDSPLRLDVVRSMLALSELGTVGQVAKGLERSALRRLGIVEVFRSQRLTTGKYRSFSPAQPA